MQQGVEEHLKTEGHTNYTEERKDHEKNQGAKGDRRRRK
jgi:hypothetical protein